MIRLELPLPVSLNKLWCVPTPKPGRKSPPRVLTAAGRQYKKDVAAIVMAERIKPIDGKLWCLTNIYPANAASDIDNFDKILWDSLKSAGVFADDKAIRYRASECSDVISKPGKIIVFIGNAARCWICEQIRWGYPSIGGLYCCCECDNEIARSSPKKIAAALRQFCSVGMPTTAEQP